MANFLTDNPDLVYYLEKGVDWAEVAELVEQRFRFEDGHQSAAEAQEFYREVLELVGEFVANEVAPRAAEIDRLGVGLEGGEVVFSKPLETVFKKLKQLDLHGLGVPRELGGMNAPALIYMASLELFARGDVSVCAHHGFHGGMALAMLLYSAMEGSTEYDRETGQVTKTRWADEIAEIVAGKAWASMDLTESDAGSDLAALRARGVLGEDGVWRVTGEKVFITSGHAKYHFVLARTEPAPSDPDDPMAGLGGLSLFLVKAFEKKGRQAVRYATFERLEEKLGHHGSATVAVKFEDSPAQLVGERGEGFRQMLLIMNNARIGVCFESIGLCESALRLARAYAAERPSMGKTIDRHEMVADYLDEMETDIQGLRALAMYGGFHEELAQRNRLARDFFATTDAERRTFDEAARLHSAKARRVTPLAKYLGAEKAVEIARKGVQIHGGVGYTREYGAEKLLRDAMVLPIYEGTSQIQALMAMKDALGAVLKNPQDFVRRTAQARWRSVSARDPLERRAAVLQGQALGTTQLLIRRTATDKLKGLGELPLTRWPAALKGNWDPKRDFAFAMLHAERFTRILCDAEIAGRLWGQARRHPERREVLERWLERAEPRVRFEVDRITSTGDRLLAKLDGGAADVRSEAG